MDFTIDGDVGSKDFVERIDANVVQQADTFEASDFATEFSPAEEPLCKIRYGFDQKTKLNKVMLLENIDFGKNSESDNEKQEIFSKQFKSELDEDVSSYDGRNDVVKTSTVEWAMHESKHSKDAMVSVASPSNTSSENHSEGRSGTEDDFNDSDDGVVDSRTSPLELENSFIHPDNSEEVDGKGNVRISEFPFKDRGSFKGVHTVFVTRLPDETLGLRLGVHSFIDQEEERVERVVVNELTSGGAANRVGQDICPGDEIVSINGTIFYEQRLENVMNFLKVIPLKVRLLVRRGKGSKPPFHSSLDDALPQELRTTHWNSSRGLSLLMNPVAKIFSEDREELETQPQNSSEFDTSPISYRSRSRPINVIHADNVNDIGALRKNDGNWDLDSKRSTHKETENTDHSGSFENHCINKNWFPELTLTPTSLMDSDSLDRFEATGNRQLLQRTNEISAKPSKEPLSTNLGLSRTEKTLSSAKCAGFPGSRGKTRLGREFLGTIEEALSTDEGEQDYADYDRILQGPICRRFNESVSRQPVALLINKELPGIPFISEETKGDIDIIPRKYKPTWNLNEENWREQEQSANLSEIPVNNELSKTVAEKCMELDVLTDSTIELLAEDNGVSSKSESIRRPEILQFLQSRNTFVENKENQQTVFGQSSSLPNPNRWDSATQMKNQFSVDISSHSTEGISDLSKTYFTEPVHSRRIISDRESDSIKYAFRSSPVSYISRAEKDSANESQTQETAFSCRYKTSSADYSGTATGITAPRGNKAGVNSSGVTDSHPNKAEANSSAKGSATTTQCDNKARVGDYSANSSSTNTTSPFGNKARVADYFGNGFVSITNPYVYKVIAAADCCENGSGSLDDGFEDDDVILEENSEIRYLQAAPNLYEERTSRPSSPAGYDKANLSIARNRSGRNDRKGSVEEGILLTEKPNSPTDPEMSGIRKEYLTGDDEMLDKSEQASGSFDKQDLSVQIESLTDNNHLEYGRQCTWSPQDSKISSKQWTNDEQWSTGQRSLASIYLDSTRSSEKAEIYDKAGSLDRKHDTEKHSRSEQKNGDHFKDRDVDILQDRNRWLVRLPPSYSADLDQPSSKDLDNLNIQSPNFPTDPKRQLTNFTPRPMFQPQNLHSDRSAEPTNSPTDHRSSVHPVSDPLPAFHHEMYAIDCGGTKRSEVDLTEDLRKHVSMDSVRPYIREKVKTRRPARSAHETLARFGDSCDVSSGRRSQEKWKSSVKDVEDRTSPPPPPLPTTTPPDFPVFYDSNFP